MMYGNSAESASHACAAGCKKRHAWGLEGQAIPGVCKPQPCMPYPTLAAVLVACTLFTRTPVVPWGMRSARLQVSVQDPREHTVDKRSPSTSHMKMPKLPLHYLRHQIQVPSPRL